MSFQKLFVPAAVVLVISGALFVASYGKKIAAAHQDGAPPAHIWRKSLVEERYGAYAKRLDAYYKSLSSTLQANAPDLLRLLDPPQLPEGGYQMLPKITGNAAASGQQPGRPAWYSWPWTDRLIDGGSMEIVRFQAELNRAETLSSRAKRSIYEKLARGYLQVRATQRNIDAHVQYNRLWQTAIASNRADYDRETALYDAALERHAIADFLKAPDDAGFTTPMAWTGRSHWIAKMKDQLRERERLLARYIHEATETLSTPSFVRVEREDRNLWILHVPFYTDIDDQDFVRSAKENIENIWQLRDRGGEFRVEVDISFISVDQLYPDHPSPRKGEKIDIRRHLALFPRDGAVLTTGALTTHVYSRAIVLGPHEISPRVLAHEFGHILGFKDSYFRGYKDLGKNGFQVMEVVAEANDIMGIPGSGPVLRRHFERILKSAIEEGTGMTTPIVTERVSSREVHSEVPKGSDGSLKDWQSRSSKAKPGTL